MFRIGLIPVIFFIMFFNRTPIIPSEETIHILSTTTFSGHTFQYGFYHNLTDEDGIILIYDETNNEVQNVILNGGNGNDVFTYIAYVDDSYFIAVSETIIEEEYSIPIFVQTEFIKYDYFGKEIDRIKFEEQALDYYNHNNSLVVVQKNGDFFYVNEELQVLQELDLELEFYQEYFNVFQGNATVNDVVVEDEIQINYPGYYKISFENANYSFEYWVTIHPLIEIQGTAFHNDYIGDITVRYNNEFYINGEIFTNEVSLEVPGNYGIRIFGENDYIFEKNIIIYPIITYFDGYNTTPFVNNLEVHQGIILFSNGISMVLNDDIYKSTIIQNTGEYDLNIYGLNDMVYTLKFYIYPSVIGIEDLGVYDNVTFELFGEALLNGEEISGSITLSKQGSYVLDLLYGQQIFETIHFEIAGSPEIETEDIDSQSYIGYGFVLLIAFGGYIILRKK